MSPQTSPRESALPLPLVRAEGTPAELGEQIGERTAAQIALSVEEYLSRFQRDAGLSLAEVTERGAAFWSVIEASHPRTAATLAGMARGSGHPVPLIAALNARTELLYGTGYEEGGCTSVAVTPEASASGHTLLAQNWDWHPQQGAACHLLATRDERGHVVLALTEAGMLAKSGMNSAGLGVCANLLVSDRDRGSAAVPYHVLLRAALESPRMSTAHQAVLLPRRSSSGNILLADAGGEAIDFELVPDDFRALFPEGGILTHANHFRSDLPVRDRKVASSALTLLRDVRLARLLAASARSGGVRIADIASALRDRYSDPDGICRLPDPEVDPADRVATVFSIMMDLDSRELWIAGQTPADHPFVRLTLDTVFRDDVAPVAEFHPEEQTP